MIQTILTLYGAYVVYKWIKNLELKRDTKSFEELSKEEQLKVIKKVFPTIEKLPETK